MSSCAFGIVMVLRHQNRRNSMGASRSRSPGQRHRRSSCSSSALVTTRTLWEVNAPLPIRQSGDGTLFVTVIGHQWWWEYRYEAYDGRKLGFITANELHIPVSEEGQPRPVSLTLKSADVCHSFWVPRLAGKTDLIPGRTNHMGFQTEKPGSSSASAPSIAAHSTPTCCCASLLILLKTSSTGWPMKPVRRLTMRLAVRARRCSSSQSCVNCHRVRGTLAQGGYAPDLTHLMGRQTLAAGMVPNTTRKPPPLGRRSQLRSSPDA